MRLARLPAMLLMVWSPALVGQTSKSSGDSVRDMIVDARQHARQQQNREALEILMRARALAPNSEDVLSDVAENSLMVGDPVGAMDALKALMRMHPKVARYPYLLGVAQLQIGMLESSVETLQRSLELDPQSPLTLIGLGLSLNAQKKYGEAKEALDRSLEMKPQEPEALAALAEAEEGLGLLEDAETHAKRALKFSGSHAGAYFTLGKVRMSQDRFEEARDYFLEAVAADPDFPKAHYQLSLAYARLNDPENSKKHQELYKKTQAMREQRLIMLRTQAGVGVGGMKL